MSSDMRKIRYIEELCLASCPQLVLIELRVQLYKHTLKKERKTGNCSNPNTQRHMWM